jgi:hypothetical protein
MRMRWMLLGLAAACSDGSSDPVPPFDPGSVDAQNGACTAFEGRRFESVDQHECGLGPGGPVMCFWHLDFFGDGSDLSEFTWRHSDVGEDGIVRCYGRRLSANEFPPYYAGTYDPTTLLLTWDALPYRLL